MTSLADQLQSIASIDASRLTSKFGVPTSKSYLFPPKTAASHDLDAIFSLAQSGFEELLSLDEGMEEFEDELFSEASRRNDRMLLNKEENAKLDIVLERCLRRLGRWIGILAGGKCIEWLVRRFRIHEMNADTVLQVFLPYHESPNFARMLAILSFSTTSPYHAPFSALTKKAEPIPRSYITTVISPARDPSLHLLSDVVGLVKQAMDEGVVHRALLTFWTATIVDLLEKGRAGAEISENTVKILVEAFVIILSTKEGGQDVNAAVYPPLVLLTRTIPLADGPFAAILSALLTPTSGANPSQRILTLLVLLTDRPTWSKGLGKEAPMQLSKIKQVGEIVVAATGKYGFELAAGIVISAMSTKPDLNVKALTRICDYPKLPSSLVDLLATYLYKSASAPSASASIKESCKSLLNTLRERHPNQVDEAYQAIAPSLPADILMVRSDSQTAFIEVYSADISSRLRGIAAIFELIDRDVADDERIANIDAAKHALKARLVDSEIPVIQAIQQKPTALFQLVSPQEYLEAVSTQFYASKPDKAVIQAHLTFIRSPFLVMYPDCKEVFTKIIFPCLLSSSNRQAFGMTEWMVVTGPSWETVSILSDMVGRIPGSWDVSSAALNEKELVGWNGVCGEYIARSLVISPDRDFYLDFLVGQLASQSSFCRITATLILTKAVDFMHGEKQVTVACRLLPVMEEKLRGITKNDFQDVHTFSKDATFKAVYKKMDARRTGQLAVVGLLDSLAGVEKPQEEAMEWMKDDCVVLQSDSSYKLFANQLYRLCNTLDIPPSLSKSLLQSLLVQLGEESLVFFASVWTTATSIDLQISSLRHAKAFISAYASSPKSCDFQMLVPSLLIALASREKAVREAAIDTLRALQASIRPSETVYGLDTFYAGRSDLVQILKSSDLTRYVQSLLSYADEIILDPGRIKLVHSSGLGVVQSGQTHKRDINHQRAIIACVMSHAQAIRSYKDRNTLLDILSGTAHSAQLQGVQPLLLPLVDNDSEECQWLSTRSKNEILKYLEKIFTPYRAQSVKVIDNDSEAWKNLLQLLKAPNSARFASQLRTILLKRLGDGLFNALPPLQQKEVFLEIVDAMHTLSTDEVFTFRASLSKYNLESAALNEVITTLAQPLESSSHKKRQRQDDTDATEKLDRVIMDLTVLIDSRDWKAVAADAHLVAALMSVLSALLARRQAITQGTDYLEQEVLGAILALVERINEPVEITSAHVGIEVVIKVIRASTNPRTSQRALLVASELARLIPDAVLHNIMPIFTFMGASDFQRDDAYSFGVVEKTISRIVPVMTKSLKDKATSSLELYKESLTFISIFTDMAGRLPRHRTLPFFVHLVKSLGPLEYLAPISMLLVDRGNTKAGRSSAASPLDLPLSLASAFDTSTREDVLLQTINEVTRLLADLASEDEDAFLNQITSENDRSDLALRRISSMLNFSSGIAKQMTDKRCSQTLVEEVARSLITMSAKSSSLKSTEIPSSIENTLGAVMQLLSVEGFLGVIVTLLNGKGQQVISMALTVFSARLPLIRPELRAKFASIMSEIIKLTSSLLTAGSSSTTVALSTLRAIANPAVSTEDAALSQAVPKLVELCGKLSDAGQTVSALSVLAIIIRRLKSRVIPYIQAIIDTSLSTTRTGKNASIVTQSFATILSVVETIPDFVAAKQLSSVLLAVLRYETRDEVFPSKFLGVLSKKITTKTLFPVVMDLWKIVKAEDPATMEAYFELLRVTLHNADRKTLPTLLKPIFTFFLEVFDLRHSLHIEQSDQRKTSSTDRIEESAIGSFLELVTKLNEATFKPLFIRLYDWAVVDLADGKAIADTRLVERKTVLLHVMMGLLDKFKHLLSPYIGTMLPHIEELLDSYADGEIADEPLWTLLVRVLGKSFDVDDGAYWTEALHLRLIPRLIAQIPLFPGSSALAEALTSLAASTTSEPVLKSLNSSICLSTRAEAPQTRMTALKVLDSFWSKQGVAEEMLPFVPETVSEFLAELLEDENSDVENMARRVLGKIEALTGSLKEYLE